EFAYRGALDRHGKIAFLHSLRAFSVPATYDEPKGMSVLEAMACGVPVVQPRRGAFTEIVERTAGGILVEPDNPASLADGIASLWQNPTMTGVLGERAATGVRTHYSVQRMADRALDVYEGLAGVVRKP
ncbi:MAG: glycosyltransferase, partial [Acidimicrobiia bacterium]